MIFIHCFVDLQIKINLLTKMKVERIGKGEECVDQCITLIEGILQEVVVFLYEVFLVIRKHAAQLVLAVHLTSQDRDVQL